MAMSGITVSDECDKAHERQHKKDKDVQWTIYCIGNHKEKGDDNQMQQQQCSGKAKQEIQVDKCRTRTFCAKNAIDMVGEKGKDLGHQECRDKMRNLWEEFVAELPNDECRYAVFDYAQPTTSGSFNDKVRFIAWSPDTSSIKNKMIYSSSKDTLKKKLAVNKETHLCGKMPDDIEDAFEKMMSETI